MRPHGDDWSIEYLRRHAVVTSADEALPFVASVSLAAMPGSALLVFLGRGRRLVDLFMIEGGEAELESLLHLACSPDEPDVDALFIVTDRTGEVPADRPDDELRWLELSDLAASGATVLLDWFVVSGTWAFSVAEHAPAPARWG